MSQPSSVTLHGTPTRFDAVFRPIARVVLTVLGLLGTALIWYFKGFNLWTPVPLALAFLVYEVIFWIRGDRPILLKADDTLTWTDRRAGRTLSMPLDDVFSARCHYRRLDGGRTEAALVLWDDDAPRSAIRLLVGDDVPMMPHDVDVKAMDSILGGYGGLLTSLAPPEIRCRQTIDDPAGQLLRYLRERLPASAWKTTCIRVWKGAAPELNIYGLHEQPHDGVLALRSDTWRLHLGDERRQGALTLLRAMTAQRQAKLVRPGAERDAEGPMLEELDIPLLLLEIDEDLQLAMPAPAVPTGRNPTALTSDTLHTHVPEGGALLWHVLPRWPQSTWPAALQKRVVSLARAQEAREREAEADEQPTSDPR